MGERAAMTPQADPTKPNQAAEGCAQHLLIRVQPDGWGRGRAERNVIRTHTFPFFDCVGGGGWFLLARLPFVCNV